LDNYKILNIQEKLKLLQKAHKNDFLLLKMFLKGVYQSNFQVLHFINFKFVICEKLNDLVCRLLFQILEPWVKFKEALNKDLLVILNATVFLKQKMIKLFFELYHLCNLIFGQNLGEVFLLVEGII
jgi:hypothetical protein